MDWLGARQGTIEKALARKYLRPEVNPGKLALFDLSSSWVTATLNPLAAHGYSTGKKRGVEQIEYGMLATRAGIPVAVRVLPGNTADTTAFIGIAAEIQALAQVEDMVRVGGRGMITSARIDALKETTLGWVSPPLAALRKRKREGLLSVTEERLKTFQKAVAAGRNNMAKHFILTITDTTLSWERIPETIAREAELDGIYVIRTSVDADTMEASACSPAT